MPSHQGFPRLLTLFLFFSLSLAAATKKSIHLPAPLGPHKNIGTFTATLTDTSRPEKFLPGAQRKIVVQAFYPISQADKQTTPYSTELTLNTLGTSYGLPNGTLSPITTNSYAQRVPQPKGKNLVPLLFSTGMGMPRFLYTTFYEELASQGYVVIAIDHPYDAIVVEFTDGSAPAFQAVPQGGDEMQNTIDFLNIRVADIKFVAQQLKKLPCSNQLDIGKLGAFGHSLGGAASAGAMTGKNTLVKAGINLDGMFPGPLNKTDVKGPFLILGTLDHNTVSTIPELSWRSFKRAQDGWVKEITLAGFTHDTYTDQGTVVELLGLQSFFSPGDLEEVLGTVKPKRARELIAAYVEDFFGWALNGAKGSLMKGPSKKYPEAKIIA